MSIVDLFGNASIKKCKKCGAEGRRMIVRPTKYEQCRGMCYPCAHDVHNRLGYSKSERGRNNSLKHSIWRLYKLTLAEFDELRRLQEFRCAICGRHEDVLRAFLHKGHPGRLAIDHCHATGKIRGLLCKPCNTMLGHARESAEILEAAIAYLARTSLETANLER